MKVFFLILLLPLVTFLPVSGNDSDFVLECSTWLESFEITSKNEFILVWGKGAVECYAMLDSWYGELFVWHNENKISDETLLQAVLYLQEKEI